MRSFVVGKILTGITAGLFVGVSLMDCASDLPPVGRPAGSGGNGGAAGSGGNGGAAGSGGNGAGGTSAMLSLPPTGGAGGNADAASDAASVVVPASADANCGTQTQDPIPQPVDLLLVLDRSASMSYDIASDTGCGAGATCAGRWSTITTSLNQVLAASQVDVHWGLKLFPSPGGQKCTVNPGADVEVVGSTAAEMQAAIAGSGPGSTGTQTPTTAAINEAVAYFSAVTDGLPHFILLATDGLPNCDPGTSAEVTPTTIQDTSDAIAIALGLGIKTYVIGIGPSLSNLDSFAAAGGTVNYFPTTSPDALNTALSTIVVAVASCVFTMSEAPPDPSNLGVYLDRDTKVPLDTLDGYSLGADNVTVTFNGSFCDGLKDGTYKVVQVFFGCPGGPPPPDVIPW